MNNLVFLRFSKNALKTLKCIFDLSENITPRAKFLWLNKLVKQQNKPVFYQECFEAGSYDFYQLKKLNNKLFLYDEIAIIFGMTPINQSFVRYIQLISALPLEWIDSGYTANRLPNLIKV